MPVPAVNLIIQWLYDEEISSERILAYSLEGYAACVQMDGSSTVPNIRKTCDIEDALSTGFAQVALSDPYLRKILPEDEIPKKHIARRNASWELIAGIVDSGKEMLFDPKLRRKLILESVKKNAKAEKVVRDNLLKYWRGGQTKNALLPNYRNFLLCEDEDESDGDQGGKRKGKCVGRAPRVVVTDRMKLFFDKAIKKFYENGDRITFVAAYKKMIEHYFSSGRTKYRGHDVPKIFPDDQIPKIYQFRYYYNKKKNIKKVLQSREGRNFYLKHREILGDSMDLAYGPGSCYQIDSTPFDVYLVSYFDPKRLIGRPFLYIVIDVYSRCIVGFHISLENPSYSEACIAIENAISDKVEVCGQYNFDIEPGEWPCQGVPESLVADRGELVGEMPDAISEGLNIRLDNTPPYRADLKGVVERFFRALNEELAHYLPGSVKKDSGSRGAPDPRVSATLNLRDFSKLVIEYIILHNNRLMKSYTPDLAQMQDSVEPRPTTIWSWGIKNRGGILRSIDRKAVKVLLLPSDEASVTSRGIRYKGLRYTCERAVRENWFARARERGAEKVKISYDPRSVDHIYLRVEGGVEECVLTKPDEHYSGASKVDCKDYDQMRKEKLESERHRELQTDVAFGSLVESTVKESKERCPKQKVPKSSLTRGIRSNRKNEIALQAGSGDVSNVTAGESHLGADEEYIPPKSHASILRRKSNPEK
ncbi:transposase family protein [Pelagicoccus sp. SDUM812005]|uniref:transposase family protein n=1 Tax=Pelagicoccus sp. SDUM812005 TaxID=3041257 RepID=UPI00280EFEB1|nr:transposase family protein [Pelagicoccus sp. SDUM812005]MDQ8181886.1 transposase family protein [Pelagicoccus sp. SDUM812005]